MYKLDSYISRAGVIGMVMKMTGVPVNATCRGDFVDVAKYTTNQDWVCRIIETA